MSATVLVVRDGQERLIKVTDYMPGRDQVVADQVLRPFEELPELELPELELTDDAAAPESWDR
jgi:hypothetical protein